MQAHLMQGWLNQDLIAARANAPQETYDRMAEFVWQTEDHMNELATKLWPPSAKGYTVPFPPHLEKPIALAINPTATSLAYLIGGT